MTKEAVKSTEVTPNVASLGIFGSNGALEKSGNVYFSTAKRMEEACKDMREISPSDNSELSMLMPKVVSVMTTTMHHMDLFSFGPNTVSPVTPAA